MSLTFTQPGEYPAGTGAPTDGTVCYAHPMSTVRDTVVIVATSTVDGTPRRKARTVRRAAGTAPQTLTVHPDVMREVRSLLREGQRLIIEGANRVLIVNSPKDFR